MLPRFRRDLPRAFSVPAIGGDSRFAIDPELGAISPSSYPARPPPQSPLNKPSWTNTFTKHLTSTPQALLLLSCHTMLLCLPIYFKAQAHPILMEAAKTKEYYRNQQSSSPATQQSRVLYNARGERLDAPPFSENFKSKPRERRHSLNSIYGPPPYPSAPTIPSDPPTQIPIPNAKFERHWSDYIDARMNECKYIFLPISLVLVSASPAIFQLPGANDDPITRFFAALATTRAAMGIVYGAISHSYVRNRIKRHGHTLSWLASEHSKAVSWSPWIILSFPVAAALQALILYMGAMMSFILRHGSTGDLGIFPSADRHALLALPVVVWLAADAGCVVWIGMMLSGDGDGDAVS